MQVQKTPILGQEGAVFINLCFAKCEKLSFFGGIFWGGFFVVLQKHYKNRYFNTFFKATNSPKNILEGYYLVQVEGYYLVPVGCVLKTQTWTRQ